MFRSNQHRVQKGLGTHLCEAPNAKKAGPGRSNPVRRVFWGQEDQASSAIPILCLLGLLFLAALLSAGCAGRSTPGQPHPQRPGASPPSPATAKPYTVLGQTYHPLTTADGFAEEGVASWYGPQFHAKRTASGEIYNMYDLTAAHRILPMQTKIRVTNLENGKSLVLRVNDRGPFVGNRIVDLSYAAAQQMDMVRAGTAKVRVEALGRWPGGIPGSFYVQVGSFSQRENAIRLMREKQSLGYPETRIVQAEVNGQRFWRVQLGMFPNLDKARAALQSITPRTPGAFVIAD